MVAQAIKNKMRAKMRTGRVGLRPPGAGMPLSASSKDDRQGRGGPESRFAAEDSRAGGTSPNPFVGSTCGRYHVRVRWGEHMASRPLNSLCSRTSMDQKEDA